MDGNGVSPPKKERVVSSDEEDFEPKSNSNKKGFGIVSAAKTVVNEFQNIIHKYGGKADREKTQDREKGTKDGDIRKLTREKTDNTDSSAKPGADQRDPIEVDEDQVLIVPDENDVGEDLSLEVNRKRQRMGDGGAARTTDGMTSVFFGSRN